MTFFYNIIKIHSLTYTKIKTLIFYVGLCIRICVPNYYIREIVEIALTRKMKKKKMCLGYFGKL